jgi:hypothetical protein
VRFDPVLVDQPKGDLGRGVATVGGQPFGIEAEAILVRSIVVLAAPASA